MADLEFASDDEIFRELAKRHLGVLLVTSNPAEMQGSKIQWLMRASNPGGGLFAALGMARVAEKLCEKELMPESEQMEFDEEG